jgi:hypothetical protein
MGVDDSRLEMTNKFIKLPPSNKIEFGRKVDVVDRDTLGLAASGKFSSLPNNHADAEA